MSYGSVSHDKEGKTEVADRNGHKRKTAWLGDELNDAQRAAVCQTEGPVLVLAGAGSGKTRVLTYRIAYLLANGLAEPREILSMTFTNKAAAEMRERVVELVPDLITGMWIGTFHSLFARLLRREAERLGYNSNYSIYDDQDREALIKTVLAQKKISAQDFPPRKILYEISKAKNDMIEPQSFAESAQGAQEETTAQVYTEYQRRLKELNAMDFDDLLLNPITLFNRFQTVREFYQNRFRYILVDEYQDTNKAQYTVLSILAQKHKNICVVGDDDQSIYRWRGAELRNILEFEHDFPSCTKFRLEQNYRSVQNILSVAHSVIKNNRQRHAKELWTKKPPGELVTLMEVNDEHAEAQLILEKIERVFRSGDFRFLDFSILYRTNAQSRILEDALRTEGIPYVIIGGVKFYERKEVKDVLAYLRILVNPDDSISLRRIINFPNRGIGEATIAKLEAYGRREKLNLFQTLGCVRDIPSLNSKTKDRVDAFFQLLFKYGSLVDKLTPQELASSLVDEIGILRLYKEEGSMESLSRMDNIRELLTAIAEFSSTSGSGVRLEDFLQRVSLTTDIDTWNDRTNAVTLMTLHSAKGLEFPIVFIVGLEEGLFPLSRSLTNPADLEEERRLFYVGATRAKERLFLSWARSRRRFGENPRNVKSRFLKELDLSFVRIESDATYQPRMFLPQQAFDSDPMPDYDGESQEITEYSIGMRVLHPTFGKGHILSIDGHRGNLKVVVLFDDAGKKRLVLPYAKLEIL